MEASDTPQVITIGYDPDTNWQAMNVAGQRLLRWWVFFGENAEPKNYCRVLADLWGPFLESCGLCAGITLLPGNQNPPVAAWVWLQFHLGPRLRLGSLSGGEIRALAELTRDATPELLRGFSFFELESTDRAGNHPKIRKHVYTTGEFVVTDCNEE